MLIHHKLDRSWLIVWTFCVLVIGIAITLVHVDKAIAEEPGVPAFRIVDVRAEQGKLAVEVQHFNPDGSHWFYEVYSWQGSEEYKYARVTNEDGEFLLEDDSVAPYKVDDLGESYQYIGYSKVYFEQIVKFEDGPPLSDNYRVVHIDNAYGNLNTDLFQVGSTSSQVVQYQGKPDRFSELVWKYRSGATWKLHDYPYLNEESILDTVTKIHKIRTRVGWTNNLGRVVLPKAKYGLDDKKGADLLVKRFEGLAWTLVESELSLIPPFEMRYDRIHNPRVFTVDGNEYLGDTSSLAAIEEYYERIDLRTQDSKTYQLNDDTRKTVFQKAVHYKDSEDKWRESSLAFVKMPNVDVWLMGTHPLYSVYGELNHISMISPDGEGGARWYTPSPITYEENSAWYEHDGLRWTYNLTNSGIKLTSEVDSPRGPKDYPFVFLPLGDANPLRIDSSGNATTVPEYDLGDLGPDASYFFYDFEDAEYTGTEIVVPRATVLGADGEQYEGGHWEIVDDYTIKFTFNDDTLPAQAFPYVIDPTTLFDNVGIDCSTTTSYGTWAAARAGSSMAWANCSALYTDVSITPSVWRITRSYFVFDTQSLPSDALITSGKFSWGANLTGYSTALTDNPADMSLVLACANGMASDTSIAVGDHAATNDCRDAGQVSDTRWRLEDIVPDSITRHYMPLNGKGLSNIDPDGNSRFMLIPSNDMDDNDPTSGGAHNYLVQVITEEGTGTKPELEVIYSYTDLLGCTSTKEIFYVTDASLTGPSFDGDTRVAIASQTWDTLRNRTSGNSYNVSPNTLIGFYGTPSGGGGTWSDAWKAVYHFDTTSIPDDALIVKAEFGVTVTDTAGWLMGSLADVTSIALTSHDTQKLADFGVGDWNATRWGKERFADDVPLNWINEHRQAHLPYVKWPLNVNGKNHINLQGVTKFGLWTDAFHDDIEPTSGSGGAGFGTWGAEVGSYAGYGERRPRLKVEYVTPCVSVHTGTVSDTSVDVFYPQTGTSASDAIDGHFGHDPGDTFYGLLNEGSSSASMDNARTEMLVYMGRHASVADKWSEIDRAIMSFDTSGLPNYAASCSNQNVTSTFASAEGAVAPYDGFIAHSGVSMDWDDIVGFEHGMTDGESDASRQVNIDATSTSGKWAAVTRLVFMFDTGVTIPANATVTSAFLSLHASGTQDQFPQPGDVGVYGAALLGYPNVDKPSAFQYSDFNRFSDVPFSQKIQISDITSPGRNTFTLNSHGLDQIQKAGSDIDTQLSVRVGFEADGEEPPWVSLYGAGVTFHFVDSGGTTEDPILSVTWSAPCPGIHSATLEFVSGPHAQSNFWDQDIAFTAAFPADPASLVQADYSKVGTVRVAHDLDIDNISNDDTTYYMTGFNNRGLAHIDDAGVTSIGLKLSADVDYLEQNWDECPTGWCNSAQWIRSADSGSAKRPILTVVHGDSSVAHIDASDIHAGGKTIILNLKGAHWANPLTDVQKQNIIDGLNGSHGSVEVYNWNQAVRDAMNISEVTRTSDTMVTILLAAHTAYSPLTTETITATINEGVTDPTLTFYPSFDGGVSNGTSGQTFSVKRDNATGTQATPTRVDLRTDLNSHSSSGTYNELVRTAIYFDTSSLNAIDPNMVISKATLGTVGESTSHTWDLPRSIVIIEPNLPSDTNITTSDFAKALWGTELLSDLFIIRDLKPNQLEYNWMPLNEEGLAVIDTNGITKLGFRMASDALNQEPPWENSQSDKYSFYSMEDPGTSRDPKLVITYERAADSNVEIISSPVFLIDKVPFEFTSFTPTMSANSGTLQMTLVGNGLPEGSSGTPPFLGSEAVTLIKSGQPNIDCDMVSGGGASVVVDCVVGSVATGDWDVYVENATGLNDIKLASLTLYQSWSSSVNGGSFSPGGSDYGIFAHDATPYFTVQGFDEVEKEWLASSSPPTTIPTAVGKDAAFNDDKTRVVVSTESSANALWAYEFDPATGVIGTEINPVGGAVSMDVNDVAFNNGENVLGVATGGGDFFYVYDVDTSAAIASFFTTTSGLANTSTKPTAACNSIDFDPSTSYIALGCDSTGSDYFHVYYYNNVTPSIGTRIANPTYIPTSEVTGVSFSPDGSKLAVSWSNKLTVYDFPGMLTYTEQTTPTNATGISWLPENITGDTLVAISSDASPYIEVYEFDTTGIGSFGATVGAPGTALTSAANFVDFHPNGDSVVVGQNSSPFVTAYNFTGVSDDDYRTYRYIANFDTSYLPTDAVISAATLSIYIDSVNESPNPWDFEVQNGEAGSEPLVVGDNDYLNYVGAVVGSKNSSTMTAGAYNDITIGSFAAIKNDTITQFILRHEKDIAVPASPGYPAAWPVLESVDIEVAGTFPATCPTTVPTSLTSDSLYNLCNSPTVPVLKLTYTSASLVSPPDIVQTFTNTDTAGSDGTYTTSILAKGPLILMQFTGSTAIGTQSSYNRPIADTGDNWNFFSSTSPDKPFPFMRSLERYEDSGVVSDGTKVLWYELETEPVSQMIDRTRSSPGSSDDETSNYMSFPLDSASITSAPSVVLSATAASISIGTEPGSPEIADDTSGTDIDFVGTSDTTNAGLPLEDFWDYVENTGTLPSGTLKLVFAMVVTIMAGIIAYRAFQSVAASYIGMLISIISFTLAMNGIFEWWMLLTFGLTAGVFIFARRAYV